MGTFFVKKYVPISLRLAFIDKPQSTNLFQSTFLFNILC